MPCADAYHEVNFDSAKIVSFADAFPIQVIVKCYCDTKYYMGSLHAGDMFSMNGTGITLKEEAKNAGNQGNGLCPE